MAAELVLARDIPAFDRMTAEFAASAISRCALSRDGARQRAPRDLSRRDGPSLLSGVARTGNRAANRVSYAITLQVMHGRITLVPERISWDFL